MGGAARDLPAGHRRAADCGPPAGGPRGRRRGDAAQSGPLWRVTRERACPGAAVAALGSPPRAGAAAGGAPRRRGWRCARRPGRRAGAGGRRAVQCGAGAGADRAAGHRVVPGDGRPGGRAGPGGPGGGAAGMAVTEARLPARARLAVLPTPLVAAPRLAEALGTGPLYLKRDDLTGFAFGGNKARPLEFLLAAATAEGADTLLTGGAPGSNFCAAAAAAALRAGLRCELVIAGRPGRPGAALALARSWGASVRWTGAPARDSVDAELPRAAAELTARGHRPFLIPRGGATGLGAAGYALAAFELRGQLAGQHVDPARVVVAVGSGGTLAGLVAGNVLLGRPWALAGASASRPPEEVAPRVLALARECLRLLARPGPLPDGVLPDGVLPHDVLPGSVRPDDVVPGDVVVADARGP